MKNSASQREVSRRSPGLIGMVGSAAGSAIVENPVLVGGSTAFLVTLFYVSANAMWYQPFPHPEPLLQTRIQVERQSSTPVPPTAVRHPLPRPDITNSVRPQATPPEVSQPFANAASDSTIAGIQAALKDLDIYTGDVDGLMGPQTRQAISVYEKMIGVPATGEVGDRLIEALDLAEKRTGVAVPIPVGVPVPEPRQDVVASIRVDAPAASPARTEIVKIQAGLRAFGNEGIEIDGVMGEKTHRAIREFQSLFGLPVTGEPDPELLKKMAEIGLTN